MDFGLRWERVRAVGKSLCAGGDIATLTEAGKDPAAPDAYEGMGKIYDFLYRLGQVKVPAVAAVHGEGGGIRYKHAARSGSANHREGRPAASRRRWSCGSGTAGSLLGLPGGRGGDHRMASNGHSPSAIRRGRRQASYGETPPGSCPRRPT